MRKLAIAHSDNPDYKVEAVHEDFTLEHLNEGVNTNGLLIARDYGLIHKHYLIPMIRQRYSPNNF